MVKLADCMPKIEIPHAQLKSWGEKWLAESNLETNNKKNTKCFDRQQSVNFASFIDEVVAKALATMLGGITVEIPNHGSLLPPKPDCVELGPTRVVGGIRPQNFDAAYRPDGPRIVFDSKTLNDLKSVGKNWQNMVNDLATESSTVHTRFPYAIVAFMVIIPFPALGKKQAIDITRTLERLGSRQEVLDQTHLAEAIALVVWDPNTGKVDETIPDSSSILRLEKFSDILYPLYRNRYKGLPPHDEEHKEISLKEYDLK